jgi:hypothetical protein
METHSLVGAWRLIRSEIQTATGKRFFPLGEACDGLMILTEQGLISAQLMRVARANFAGQDMRTGTAEELREAFEGYVALWGVYEVDTACHQMRYQMQGSLFPNWVGQTNLRDYELKDDLLTLKTPPFPYAGESSVAELTWKRVPTDAPTA